MNSARQESPLPTGKMQSQTSPPPPEEVQQQAKSNNGGNGGSTSSCKTVWVNAEFSVYVGNLDPDTSVEDMEELLYELFLQAGPLSRVYVPFSQDSNRHKCFGFVEFQHVESVPYSLQLMSGIRLCGRVLNLGPATPALPPPTSSSSLASSSSVSTSGNPFVSAFESRVAQKEAEMVAANPFLNSLNTHLGGLPLPLPPSSLPPPPSSLRPPPSSLPPPLYSRPPPLPPLPPPPGLLPPVFSLLPPPNLPPLLPPPNLPPPSLPLLPIPVPTSLPPVSLPTPPPPILPLSTPPPFLSLPQTLSITPSTPLPCPPPLLLPPLLPPTSSPLSSTTPLLQFGTLPPPHGEQNAESAHLLHFGTLPPPHGEQNTESTPLLQFGTPPSTRAEQNTESAPLLQFATPPPPCAEQNTESTSCVSLSLAQTVMEMASTSVDDSEIPPHSTSVVNSTGDEQFGTVLTGNDTPRMMENCSLSLEVCLEEVGEGGSGTYLPSPDGGCGTDQIGFQMELERQSQSGNGLFSGGVSEDKRNPFTDNNMAPYPCDDQRNSGVGAFSENDQLYGDSGMVPHPSDDQTNNSMAPYPGNDQTMAPYPGDDQIMAPYPGDDQTSSGIIHFSDDDQPDSSMAPYPGGDKMRNSFESYPKDSYQDDKYQDGDSGYYVSSPLLRKHNRFEAETDQNYHHNDEPFHNGPPHPPPEVPLEYHTDLQPFGPPPTKLHRSRLGSRDHPSWLSRETRRSLQDYHRGQLQRLQDTIGQLKEAIMIERCNSPLHPHTPPPPQY